MVGVTFAPLEAFSLLIRLELDAHLVVATHKAPHEVQRRRLLHVLLKVMEGVVSHVRKAKACGLVAQHEVRLLLRVLLHKHGEGVALHTLKVFRFQSWKSMMCVRRLSKKAVAFEVQIMLLLKDSSQSSSHLMLSCDRGLVNHDHIVVHQLSRAQLDGNSTQVTRKIPQEPLLNNS